MSDFGCGLSQIQTFFERLGIPGCWRYTHGTAIGGSAIGLTTVGKSPLPERLTIGLMFIASGEVFEEVDEYFFVVRR